MPSLAQIPSHLLDPEMQLDFLFWLGNLPISENTAKEYMKLWKDATGHSFDADDWNYITRALRL